MVGEEDKPAICGGGDGVSFSEDGLDGTGVVIFSGVDFGVGAEAAGWFVGAEEVEGKGFGGADSVSGLGTEGFDVGGGVGGEDGS